MAAQRRHSFDFKLGAVLVGVLALVSLLGFLIWRQWGPDKPGGSTNPVSINTTTSTTIRGGQTVTASGGNENLSIRLSEGQAVPQGAELVRFITGQTLSDEEIERILARLPALTGETGDQVDFRLPEDPIPPPLTGDTVGEPFPPLDSGLAQPEVVTGPLEVLRYSPVGEIPVAPVINVTFNQPMVPLGTLEDLALEEVPVQIEPAIPGTWRWIGAKTLTFQHNSDLIDRLPKATDYRVTIPAGTKSASGGTLLQTVEWTFTTPAPVMTSYYPADEPQPREPLFFISFDQRIDPEAVLRSIQVSAGGSNASLVLANEADIESNERVKQLQKYALEGRWLAFKTTAPLPADTAVTVTVKAGTPSAEGPRRTAAPQSYSFRTYAPLRIEEHRCAWYNGNCPPLTPFYIRFNNPIDTAVYSDSMITIQPELPGASVNIYGNSIEIQGATKGQTTYTVTVSREIQDTFGQKLGQDARLTFKVGKAEPLLMGPNQVLVTLDPVATKPALSVYVVNYTRLDVKIHAVRPDDWPAYMNYLQNFHRTDQPPTIPGRLVSEQDLRVEAATDSLTQVDIDLSPYMDGGYGHFVLSIAPPKGLFENENDRYWRTIHTWVQITQIGLDAFVDHSEMVAWTTALKDGQPLGNVNIRAGGTNFTTATGADGTVRFALPPGVKYLVAAQGADQALLPRSSYYWDEGVWNAYPPADELRWYVFDDRKMYRPGEEVHIKGWIRRIGGKQDGDVSLLGGGAGPVLYSIMDPYGNHLGSGQAEVNALGGFDFAFTLPENVTLGQAYISLVLQGSLSGMSGSQNYHYFEVQEFRRPEFEVTARNETTGPYFAGEHAVVAVQASYFAGGALPNAEVTWQVSYFPGSYSPPNWPDFIFGTWQPWWWYDWGNPYGTESRYETFSGKTDATGTHYLRLDFDGSPGPKPVSVLAESTVMDVNRQAWSSSTSLLVHPASLYIGLRSERYFVERGTPIKVDVIVTDLDGNPVVDRPVVVTAARLEWKYKSGTWAEEEADVQTCSVGSGSEPVTCSFPTPVGGTYQITAVVTDPQGRQNQSRITRWVSGGERPPSRKVEQEEVTLIPSQETYQPGEVAQILVQSPFSPAEGLLTVTRSGILYTERFTIEDGTYTLNIPIEDRHIPNLNIQVDLAGSAPRLSDDGEPMPGIPPRPAYATGQLTLNIPPLQRTLSVEVTPAERELEPGGETTLSVVLLDANGAPVQGAELAVVVVDEAILSLTGYSLADPTGVFYTQRPSYLQGYYSRGSIILIDPLKLVEDASQVIQTVTVQKEMAADRAAGEAMPMPAAAQPTQTASMESGYAPPSEGQAEETAPIRIRVDFNPLAVFAPQVKTDADGKATLPVTLPDNLTRYRIMVVAVEGGQRFGTGEANLVARLPLMARPSAPRFLNFGDRFELPVVLQNQTDNPMEVDVVVRAANLELTGPAGQRVTVPARDRIEVRFPAAALMAGTARMQFAVVAGSFADAIEIELPVYTPATTEAFATYGVVDQGAVFQPVDSPTNVFPQYGGLEINTSSTALQALTDAVLYLVSYPFECSEQLASRILAVAALRDVLTAFEAEGLPSAAEMEAAVTRDIDQLQGMQNYDGGFPYWRRGFESNPFNTIHVAHALYRAQSKGFGVPADMLQNVLSYLRNIESYYPSWYSPETRRTLTSYAVYVRNLFGDRDPEKALRLITEAGGVEAMSMETIGWLWPVLQDAPNASPQLESIRRHVNNRVVETAGAANFTTDYSEQTYLLLSSDRRTDAILLDALMIDNPDSDLIPKLVNGLLAHRVRGRWNNTQENVFVLLALDRYFNTYEAQTPNFVTRIWLGETYAGSHEYRGRTTERHETLIPMTYLVDETLGGGQTQNLVLSKDGPGRLYYRLGLRYAPSDLNLDPLDMGFVVERRYEAVDDPGDVYQDSDGVWHIKAGARVRVRITMVADNRRYHVALVDPLPAGLEIVNPALAVSSSTPPDPTDTTYRERWWWWGPWYEHQNLRDERAEAFTSLLWEGVYEYTYIARATTPGTFTVPPAKAEEMYSPEVFGRSSSDWVIVK